MKKAMFWDVAPCRCGVNRRFGRSYRFHLQSRGENKKIRKQRDSEIRCKQGGVGNKLSYVRAVKGRGDRSTWERSGEGEGKGLGQEQGFVYIIVSEERKARLMGGH
jgi:hypothetical protein